VLKFDQFYHSSFF